MNDRRYDTTAVARAAQISLRQLQWWDEQGLVSPPRDGNANRTYRTADVTAVLLIAALRKKGLSLQKLRRLLANRQLFFRIMDGKGERFLVVGGKSCLIDSRDKLIDLFKVSKIPLHVVELAGAIDAPLAKLDANGRR